MSIPILTIPESAYEAQAYLAPQRSKSHLLLYILKLTRTSSIAVVLIYLVGYFAVKPVLETGSLRRLEVLDLYRTKLRDLYLNLIGRVSHIPIVSFNRANGKCYSDSITQTDESYFGSKDKDDGDKLSQNGLLLALSKLSQLLTECDAYLKTSISSYEPTNSSLRSFQNQADLKYFNTSEFFNVQAEESGKTRTKDIVVETKNEIRGIKGLYMSGQV
jgi:hypothetical protein